jgi:hypothetical protein
MNLIVAASSSPAGIITASSTVLIAIGGIIATLTVFIPVLRTAKSTNAQVHDVHIVVNQQRTDMKNYQRALVKALVAAGIEVPEDQSLDDGTAEAADANS